MMVILKDIIPYIGSGYYYNTLTDNIVDEPYIKQELFEAPEHIIELPDDIPSTDELFVQYLLSTTKKSNDIRQMLDLSGRKLSFLLHEYLNKHQRYDEYLRFSMKHNIEIAVKWCKDHDLNYSQKGLAIQHDYPNTF